MLSAEQSSIIKKNTAEKRNNTEISEAYASTT